MILHLKAKPNSREDKFSRNEMGELILHIKAPPVDGKANKYIIQFLAKFFGIPKSFIQLKKGETNAHKAFCLEIDEILFNQKLENID